MTKLGERINNKNCCILLGGASLELLRRISHSFKGLGISWCGMNLFDLGGSHVLSSIGEKYSLVFDVSTVKNYKVYEKEVRVPRVTKYLESKEAIWITSRMVERHFTETGFARIFTQYKDKIFFIDEIINLKETHNSLMSYLMLLTYFNAKNIYLFGCDGYQGEYIERNALLSYFCPTEVKRDFEIASGGTIYIGLNSDTEIFNGEFRNVYLNYCTKNKLVPRRIINVNKDSFITIFPRLELGKVLQELELENKNERNN